MLQWVPTWNINELGIPRSFLLSLWKSQPWRCASPDSLIHGWLNHTKGEKERGACDIGFVFNKNKHNISLIIIPLPPVSITFSTASESLNLSSSTVTKYLHRQHHNAVAASLLPKRNPPLPESYSISAVVLRLLVIENHVFFLTKKISSLHMKWRVWSHRCPKMISQVPPLIKNVFVKHQHLTSMFNIRYEGFRNQQISWK